jgi:hypothetical protein
MRRKTSIYMEESLLRAAHVEAASSGRSEYDVFEEAVCDYLGWRIIGRARSRADISEWEAMEIARTELAAYRREQDETAPST